MSRRDVVLTAGDPAGCGPAISLRAVDNFRGPGINFFIVGDEEVFRRFPLYRKIKNKFTLVDVKTMGITKLQPGFATRLSGQAALSYLDKGLAVLRKLKAKHLVTAPLSKEAVRQVSPGFRGHTEYLAGHFKAKNVVMLMVAPKIKTALLTRHIPLSDIPRCLRKREVANLLSLVYSSLKRQFKINKPRIVFASVNPHAGIDTFLEREERILLGAIKDFGKSIHGPYPADTLFVKHNLKKYDCFVCAYHDQAMIPFKLLSFPAGVNVTLGLPIVRTSPAHGVAYDVIREGKDPFHSSMLAAVKLALNLSP